MPTTASEFTLSLTLAELLDLTMVVSQAEIEASLRLRMASTIKGQEQIAQAMATKLTALRRKLDGLRGMTATCQEMPSG